VIPLFPAEETEEGSRRGEEEEKGKEELRLRRWKLQLEEKERKRW